MLKRLHALLFTLALTLPGMGARTLLAGDSLEGDDGLIQAGHWKQARASLEMRVKNGPRDAHDSYLLAQVRVAFQDFQGALPLAQRAVELDGRNSNYHLILGQVYGELAARASVFAAGALAAKFRKEIEAALELDPNNLEALDSMMVFKFRAPGLLGGDKSAACAIADKIARIDPSRGYLARAELAELENNPVEVEANYLKAVEADPKSYGAQTTLAKFWTSTAHTKLDLAAQHANQALEINPSRGQAYGILARAYALGQRWNDLDSLLAASKKAAPDDLIAYYEAAQAQLETCQQYARAEAYAKKYLSQEPEGEEPDAADAHRLLGLVLEKQGHAAEARTEIQSALQLRPNFKAAREDLKRLKKQ